MQILFNHLKSYTGKLVLIILLLIGEATACFASPILLGDVIHIGIQKKGFDDTCPVVISLIQMKSFRRLLPSDKYDEFLSLYKESTAIPQYADKKYDTRVSSYYLKSNADTDKATELYRNGITVALVALRKSDGYEDVDYDDLVEKYSASMITSASSMVNFSESEKREYYDAAADVSQSIKIQLGDIVLPYLYDDAGISCEDSQLQYTKSAGFKIIIFTVLQCIAAFASSVLISSVSVGVELNLRRDIAEKVFRFRNKDFKNFSHEKISDIFSTGIRQVGVALQFSLRAIFYSLITAIMGCAIAFSFNKIFGILILSTSILIFICIALIYKLGYSKYYRMQDNYAEYSDTVKTDLKQMFTVRSAGACGSEQDKVKKLSGSIKKDEGFVMRAVLCALSIMGFIVNLLTAAVIIMGSTFLLKSDISIGEIVAGFQISLIAISSLTTLGAVCIFAPKAFITLKNVLVIMNTSEENIASAKKKMLPVVDEIKFDNVKLYDSLPAVSFVAKKGQVTVLTGATGTGKSGLMLALIKEQDIYSGEIQINGENIYNFSADSPANIVTFVPSNPVIFTDTIRKNMLLFGANTDENGMLEALEKANCDFLELKKNVLDLVMENNGELFSGGQKSRLSLSFALSKKSPIYIFDSCLSMVDPEMRKKILQKLYELKKNAAVIITAQNDEEYIGADCIVSLDRTGGD